MLYKQKIQNEIAKILNRDSITITIEKPKQKEYGDISTNIAMVLAKELRKNPIEIANNIKEKIKGIRGLISNVEVVKPGFINIFVDDYTLAESLVDVHKLGKEYGIEIKKTKGKVLVEFVSSNPTGDLHIGHGRQAVIGDTMSGVLEANGYEVNREFYINDYGEQIVKLTDSAYAVYEKLNGKKVEWKEDFYPEEMLLPYVKQAIPDNVSIKKDDLGTIVKDLILSEQKKLLSSFNVNFNIWFSEAQLHQGGEVKKILEDLKSRNYTYEKEGAVWFKSEELGDTRDRVLIRSDGRPTYLLSDIAYHVNKLNRGFDYLITIFGADHHGQEISLKCGLQALGYDDKKLEIVLVQMVSLKQGKSEVKMSKRAGTVVSTSDVLKEVGPDAFRYFLMESHPNNRMIFDIDLAKKQDKDNPVFYIQYAHARCCSIFKNLTYSADEINKWEKEYSNNPDIYMNLFSVNNQEYEETKALLLKILDFPEEIELAAMTRSPGRIANFLKDLATEFHQFYTVCRVLSDDIKLTKARLGVVLATKITIANGLKILGISAPESM